MQRVACITAHVHLEHATSGRYFQSVAISWARQQTTFTLHFRFLCELVSWIPVTAITFSHAAIHFPLLCITYSIIKGQFLLHNAYTMPTQCGRLKIPWVGSGFLLLNSYFYHNRDITKILLLCSNNKQTKQTFSHAMFLLFVTVFSISIFLIR